MTDIQATNARVIEQFRAGGEITGMHRERLVLLSTTGARTGRRRTTPMMFVRDRDRLLVIASNAGAAAIPHWYRNLVADPHVTVEIDDERYDALAVTLTEDDLARTWARIKEQHPFFADHEARAGRPIPIVALTRLPGATTSQA